MKKEKKERGRITRFGGACWFLLCSGHEKLHYSWVEHLKCVNRMEYVVHHLYWQQEAKLLICNLRERLQTMGKKRPLTACDKRRSEKITSTCLTQLTNVEKHKRNIIFPIFFFKISALWTISFGVIPNPTSLFPSLPFCLPSLNFFNDFIAVLFSRFFPPFFIVDDPWQRHSD